ncbi:response regulator [Nocardioides humi]|uniref:Response regulator transcription factor n=1 Tax=Nocardioides humi TaxID=449461 RepID=A0ABN1ZPP5_9ACTN|nr:response regulator transcription factor [Nocardioides humi]
MTGPVRVLVADDHVFYREGIQTLLAAHAHRVELVGAAESGEQAVELALSLAPDVVLMDVKMPGGGGIAATRRLAEARPEIAVLMLTMADDDSVLPALRAGARGYLLKDAGVDDLVRAIESTYAGQAVLAPQAAERVHRQLARPAPARPFPQLTDREHDLLAELLRGRSNRQIAAALGLSEKTVSNYLSNILAKLDARDRAHLVELATAADYPAG